MNSENLKACGINYDEGLHRFSGHVKIYEKYLLKLVNLDIYEDLKRNISEDDTKTAFEDAHKLKAFIGNLSIPDLYEKVSKVTDILRNDSMQEVDKIMQEVDTIITRVTDVIKEESSK